MAIEKGYISGDQIFNHIQLLKIALIKSFSQNILHFPI
jgi:hypothetical protein